MKFISLFLSICVIFFGFFQSSFAGDIPFTDIKISDSYYYSVKDLYEGGIITDNGDHLFRPNNLMSRDFFVSLAVEIGCHECETPNIDDIIKYQISPFVDLPKTNNYYYCIAYAADNGITQGYILNEQNKAYCENKKEYTSSPFCAENTISRIEATAILLRRAKLWNDILNQSSIDKSLSIPDVTSYWYGYAKKGIDIGILTPKTNGSIGQDDKITRGEFAIMAAKILQYTQCNNNPGDANSIESSILILDSTKKNTNKSKFSLGEDFSLVPLTNTGSWNYNWTLKNPITGEVIFMTGNIVPGTKIPEGTWITTLQVIDPNSNKQVSESRTTITIGTNNNYTGDIGIKDGNGNLSNKNTFSTKETITLVSTHTGGPWNQTWEAVDEKTGKIVTGQGKELPGSKLGEGNWSIKLITKDPKTGDIIDTDTRQIRIIDSSVPPTNTNNILTVHLSANPILVNLGETVQLNTNTNGTGGLIYKWNFGDGNTSTSSGGTNSHSYTTPGIYPVTVTVVDPQTGNTAQSRVVIRVTGNTDTDGDGIFDNNDNCPYIYAKTINGCPIVNTYNPNNNGNNTNTNNSSNNGLIAAQIGIRGSSGQILNTSIFNRGDVFNLVPVTNTGTWNYTWQATNPSTGQVINGTGSLLSGSGFNAGDWKVVLNVIDPKTNLPVATPSITIRITETNNQSGSGKTGNIPCVTLIANPLSTTTNNPIDFTSNICPSNTPLIYSWDYGDGTTFPTSPNTSHSYTLPGIYTVILKVTDPITGKIGESKVIIHISGISSYSDGLGLNNNICLMNYRKKQGLLVGKPNCTQCPCSNSIEINSLIRSCDVVFPTVLSPTLNTIYTRGGFYPIP